jgi:hypothetical protein
MTNHNRIDGRFKLWFNPDRVLFDNFKKGKRMSFTAIFQKVPEGFVGFVEELPGANTQGATLKEVRKNLKEAIRLVLEANGFP